MGALLPGRVGLLVRLVCKEGVREAVLDSVNRYMDGLVEEPGTEAFLLALDPDAGQVVWLYEWFTDEAALDEHRSSDGLRSMMEELPELLESPVALIRIDPLRMHVHRRVVDGETVDGVF
jgi:quinol monooxygenase YgiN